MPSGLLCLALSGENDKFLIENPNITFFKFVYKKTVNFSNETLELNFNSDIDFDKTIVCHVSKVTDLISNIYVKFNINKINNYGENEDFAFVKKLGYALIKEIQFEVGNNVIETIYTDWLNIWNELNVINTIDSLNELIGNKPDIYNFSKSKEAISLLVPINFWFSRNYQLAFPLISIKMQELKINLTINSIDNIINIGPTKKTIIHNDFVLLEEYEIIRQQYNDIEILGIFLSFDFITKTINYIDIKNSFYAPSNLNDIKHNIDIDNDNYIIVGEKSKFEFYLSINTYIEDIDKSNNNKIINQMQITSSLLVDCIYLDNEERNYYSNNNHNYLINIPQYNYFYDIINNNLSLKLNFTNLSKELIWVCKLNYLKKFDLFNYTNNYDENKETLIISTFIKNNYITIASLDSLFISDILYPYYYYSKIPDTGINLYSFCVNNNKDIQPNGHLNLIKLTDLKLDLKFKNDKFLINNEISIIVINNTYNILKIDNGICSLLFTN